MILWVHMGHVLSFGGHCDQYRKITIDSMLLLALAGLRYKTDVYQSNDQKWGSKLHDTYLAMQIFSGIP